jgi:hypothetical protein
MDEMTKLRLALLIMAGFKYNESFTSVWNIELTSKFGKRWMQTGDIDYEYSVTKIVNEVYNIFPIADEVLREVRVNAT